MGSLSIINCKKKATTEPVIPDETTTQEILQEKMTHLASGWSTKETEAAALAEAVTMMQQGMNGYTPGMVTLYTTGGMQDHTKIYAALKARLEPATRIWGLNSGQFGVITEAGRKKGLTIMGIYSRDMVVWVGFPFIFPDKSMFVTHEPLYEGNEIGYSPQGGNLMMACSSVILVFGKI